MRYKALAGVVYDSDSDTVVRDLPRMFPSQPLSRLTRFAEKIADGRNAQELRSRQIDRIMRENTGVL